MGKKKHKHEKILERYFSAFDAAEAIERKFKEGWKYKIVAVDQDMYLVEYKRRLEHEGINC